MPPRSFSLRDSAPAISIWLLVLAGLAFGFSLDRYPSYYLDDAFFAYPAWKAALGGPFVYVVSAAAPFGSSVWAYHGPLLPNFEILMFKLFGFSAAASRLPDFLGGWIAALLIVLFFKRRGYRYAGLIFVFLWSGDRSVQELMYGRMDGLALLSVVLSFLCLERTLRKESTLWIFLCGVFCGLSPLIHPLCVLFAVVSFLIVFYYSKWKGACVFLLGAVLNVPLLLLFWRFRPSAAWTQFRWHARVHKIHAGAFGLLHLLSVLRWSRYWFFALCVFSIASAAIALFLLLKRGRKLSESETHFFLAATFGLAGLAVIFDSAMYPYYIIYFSIWPMMCIVILTEKRWQQFRPIALVLALLWCTSAAWNLLRLREAIKYYPQLSKRFLYAELRKDVPSNATVVTTPELYSVPIEAGYKHFGLTTYFEEHQDICHSCYLLLTAEQFRDANFVSRDNLDQRKVLYSGPAFPGAGQMVYPIVLLSPQQSISPETGSIE